MQPLRWLSVGTLLSALTFGTTSQAAGDSPELRAAKIEATRLANEGLIAYESGDSATAATKLSAAFDALQVPSIALWLGRADLNLGKLAEALALFRRAQQLPLQIGNPKIQKQAQLDAAQEEAALLQRVPRVRFESNGTSPGSIKVSIDGQPIELGLAGEHLVNPGQHEISVDCSRRVPNPAGSKRILLTIAESETQAISIECPALPPPTRPLLAVEARPSSALPPSANNRETAHESPGRRVVFWSALGVGATGIVVGSVAGIVAASRRSDLDGRGCHDQHCPSAVPASDVDSYNRWRHVSTGGFVVAAIGAATGITVWLTASKRQKSNTAALVMDPQTVGLMGKF